MDDNFPSDDLARELRRNLHGPKTVTDTSPPPAVGRIRPPIPLPVRQAVYPAAMDVGPEPAPRSGSTMPSGPIEDKKDTGKDRWDLVPWKVMTLVVKVISYGASKYTDDGWKKVPNAKRRYLAAAMRHLTAWRAGEKLDPESGHPHLTHAIVSLMFVLAHDGHMDTEE